MIPTCHGVTMKKQTIRHRLGRNSIHANANSSASVPNADAA
jgi:hypothetical protein